MNTRLLFTFAVLLTLGTFGRPSAASAQTSFTGAPITHTFAGYRGLGINPGGTTGALDSNAWIISANTTATGTCALGATCPAVPPPSFPSGPFYGGPSMGGETAGSIYSFDTGGAGGGNPSLGVQSTGAQYQPGALTAVYQNNSAGALSTLTVSYVFGEFNDVDTRGQQLVVAIDPDGPGAATPIVVAALGDSTRVPMSALGGWQLRPHTAVVSLAASPIAVGAVFHVIFAVSDIPGGSGARDELSIDDVRIASGPVVGSCGNGIVEPGEDCEPGAAGGGCCTPTCTFAARGTECRPRTGETCDAPDVCNNVGVCLATFAPSTLVCRPAAAGGCDVAENCTGTDIFCPTNASAPNGTPCPNGTVCDGSEVCAAGTCAAGMTLDCDDSDPCTADACAEPGGCRNTPIAGCMDGGAVPDGGTGADGGNSDGGGTGSDSGVIDSDGGGVDSGVTDGDGGMTAIDGGAPTDTGPRTDTGPTSDTGPRDGGGVGIDAGIAPMAGGCACRTGTNESGTGWLVFLALVGLVLSVRRRRA